MTDNSSESGYELVLDNRKLIVAFAVLVLVCGCCFVVGFVEGKRQGYRAGSQAAGESAAEPARDETLEPASSQAAQEPGKGQAKEAVEEQRLHWYRNVSGQEEKPEIIQPAAATDPSPGAPAKKPPEAATTKAPVTYSVQAGAFRQRDQADEKARLLQSMGFECRIEPPRSPEELYLLKIGYFKSRADAVAMQLRLKQSGFSSFVKTN